MILKDDVYKKLDSYLNKFNDRIFDRGQDIVVEHNQPGEVLYDKSNGIFRAEVWGTMLYQVRLNVENSVKGLCTCPYQKKCKHLAAVALVALEFPERLKLNFKKEHKTDPSSSVKQKGITKTKEHHISGQSIEAIFRGLDSLRRKGNSVYSYYQHEHQLVGDGLVHSSNYDHRLRMGPRKLMHSCIIQFEEKKVIVRCEKCAFDKNFLCNQAFEALADLLANYRRLGADCLNFQDVLQKMSVQENISPDAFRKVVKILIGFRTHEFVCDDSIISQKWIQSLSAKFKDERRISEEIMRQLEEGLSKAEAIVWSSSIGSEFFGTVFLIEGKVSANRDKLSSHIRYVEEPVLLNHEIKILYKEIESISNASEEYDEFQDDSRLEEAILKLRDNIAVLQSSLHYLYDPFDSRYSHEMRLKKKDLTLIRFSEFAFDVKFHADVNDELYSLTQKWMIAGEVVDFAMTKEIEFTIYFALIDEVAYLYDNPNIFALSQMLEGRIEMKFLPRNKLDFVKLLEHLEDSFVVERGESLAKLYQPVKNCVKNIILSEAGDYIVFRPLLSKSKMQFDLYNPKEIQKKRDGSIVYPDRNELDDFKNQFELLHPHFADQITKQNIFYLNIGNYIKDSWHIDFFEKCKDLKIKLKGLEELERNRFSKHKAKIEIGMSSEIDWFELNVSLSFGKEKVERKKWIKALKEGKSYVLLADGSIGMLPEEWVAKMGKLLTIAEVDGAKLQINKLRFNVLDDFISEKDNKTVFKEVSTKKKLLKSFKELKNKQAIPSIVQATLRPYQEASFQWMCFLQRSGFGGILADDMGLGKTLQLICLLAAAKETDKCYALIVVPRSLIFNWVNEIEKFCPSLSCHVHHGAHRHEAISEVPSFDVIISTYGTVVNDINLLSKETFSHIVLDESQAIKNPASKRYKKIRLLKSPYKICATGTPIQNNTFDLYAQVSFANPGLLGNQSYFKKNFAIPIDKHQDRYASDLLTKMIHPFILRRTKDQVAKDLPDKVESVIYCEMLPQQRKMYTELKEQIKSDLLSLDESDSQLKFKVLDGLLRLRQLCNSPLLLNKKLVGKKAESIKIESLMYKLTEEIGDGNALVFSQFVQMLELIRKELDAQGIPYAYLDGRTRKRQKVVDAYMNDAECRIFLISLKAGNTGLNLTKAQYVFLVDPWWNPAAEAQAIDRTHRIGQTKKVFAYKMVCRDTIEEKILLLQRRKKTVASRLIQVDESSFKNMNKKDLMALFD